MHKHKTDFASVLGYLTAGVNCFADWRLRGEMMGSLQEYLLGVVDVSQSVRILNSNQEL